MLNNHKIIHKIFTCVIGLGILISLMLLVANYLITSSTKEYTYDDLDKIPANEVGVIMGTSKYRTKSGINNYFKARIDAAVDLYNAGKIKMIIVSGDNSSNFYNEPRVMRKELIKNGIPENRIIFDFAGFRTLDSVIRANKIFGQSSFTVISQKFQNERAIYIAQKNGFNAIGYNAKGDPDLKMTLREYLARFLCVVDVLVINREPKFLGKPENIQLSLEKFNESD